MKRFFKTALATLLTLSMMVAPCMATDITTNNGSATTTVTYAVESTWSVGVPTEIAATSSGTAFQVTAKGNIANDQYITVETHYDTITLTSTTNSSDKVSVKFSMTSNGEAVFGLGKFDNANSEGNTETAIGVNEVLTFNQSITAYAIMTTENPKAGEYTGTTAFVAKFVG